MKSAAFDDWVQRARAVPIERETERRGIKLNGGRIERCGPCPCCGGDDRFSINTAKQVFNCRGCGAKGDVIDLVRHLDECDFIAAGTTLVGEPPPKGNGEDRAAEAKQVAASVHPYPDESGTSAFVVERFEFQNPDGSFVLTKERKHKKIFRQKRPDPDRPGGWIYNVDGVRALLYRLPDVLEALGNDHTICVVEGEGKADLFWSWNIPATCCAMGAGKWKPDHSQFLRGADVVILPDNDAAGGNHAELVATSLQGVAGNVRVLELPNLPPKGDIVDWAAAGGTVEKLHDLIEREAKPWIAAADKKSSAGADCEDDHNTEFLSFSPVVWHDEPIPLREWIVDGVVPKRNVTMLSGDGGLGKTLLAAQLQIAGALGAPWLGIQMAPITSLGLYCEDDIDELHRRTADICSYHGCVFQQLGDVHLTSRVGDDNLLVTFDKHDVAMPTPLYNELTEHAADIKAQLIVLDSLHDLFGGNEIMRTHARQFIGLLRRLALRVNGAVLLCAHPSLAGINSGTGTSGSTAWNNAVRSRLYLTKPDEEDVVNEDTRILKTVKANYAPLSAIDLTWRSGVFVRNAPSGDPYGQIAETFLQLLDKVIAQGSYVSPAKASPEYAPKVFVRMRSDLTRKSLETAMRALLNQGKITIVTRRKANRHIVEALAREASPP
jgi:RecA-family ATPase